MNREDAVRAIVANGKTEEQAKAFLDLLGSAFARRGWIEGESLSAAAIAEKFDAFMGPSTEDQP